MGFRGQLAWVPLIAMGFWVTACSSSRPAPDQTSAERATAPTPFVFATIPPPSPTVVAAPPPSPPPTEQPVAQPVAAPSPAAPAALLVRGTGTSGLTVRRTPGGESVAVAQEGQTVNDLGDRQQAAGREWQRIRTSNGAEGWAASEFLVADALSAAAPPPVAAGTVSPETRAYIDSARSKLENAERDLKTVTDLALSANTNPALLQSPDWSGRMTIALALLKTTGQQLQTGGAVPKGAEASGQVVAAIGGDLTYIADEMTAGISATNQTRVTNATTRMRTMPDKFQGARQQLDDLSKRA